MEEKDVPQVVAIERQVFPTPWSEEAFLGEVRNNALAVYLVLVEENQGQEQLLAYGGLWKIFDEGHITNVAVDSAHQGKKLGRFLLHGLIDWAWSNQLSHLTLEVRVSNKAAIALYEKAGFKIAGRRPGYYEDTGEDALIMWLHRPRKEEKKQNEQGQ